MRSTFTAGRRRSFVQEAREVAEFMGLQLHRYNPGDQSSYRVGLPGDDYFSTPGMRFDTAREALAFLRGVQDARELLARRGAQQNRDGAAG